VQAGGAIGVAGVDIGTQHEQPPDCSEVKSGGEGEEQTVDLVEVLQGFGEDGARWIARAAIVDKLVVARRLKRRLRAHAHTAEHAVPHDGSASAWHTDSTVTL